jgi:N-acetylglucosamine kinase-like BadF-type ATPase
MFYLGVDGGGTKTTFILIDQEGKICGYTTEATCHYRQVGMDNFQKVLTAGIKELCNQVSIEITQISYSFLGLPGFGEDKDSVPKLEAIVNHIFQGNRFKCGNDVEAGWAGSLACRPGINLVGGTGAIGFGRDQQGNSDRASGWGYFCGDEGSAYWLGKNVISLFGKEADGREERTPLYDIIRSKFHLQRDLDFCSSIVCKKLEMKRDKISRLALLLYQAAKKGDAKAVEIYRKAAYEYSLTVKALINKLNFNNGEDILVSYSGGVFKAGSYILDPLKKYLDQNIVKLIRPILQPVTGAALYALLLDKKLNDYDLIVKKLKEEEKRLCYDD